MALTDATIYNATLNASGGLGSLSKANNKADLSNAWEYLRNNSQYLNTFLQTLANKVGRSVIEKQAVTQPLARFKQASMPYGDTIETISVGLAKEHAYQMGSKRSMFDFDLPDVATHYSRENRKSVYDGSISLVEVQKAFTSEGGMIDLLQQMIDVLYQSNRADEFTYMEKQITNAYKSGNVLQVEVGNPSENDFGKKVVQAAKRLIGETSVTSNYNLAHRTLGNGNAKKSLLLSAEADASVAVNINATAYNLSSLQYDAEDSTIPYFSDDNLVGVLLADNALIVADTLPPMIQFSPINSEDLMIGFNLHVRQVMDVNPYALIIAFVKKIDAKKSTIFIPNDTRVSSAKEPAKVYVAPFGNYKLTGAEKLTTTVTSANGVDASSWVDIKNVILKDSDGTFRGINSAVTPTDQFLNGHTVQITYKLVDGDQTYTTAIPLQLQTEPINKEVDTSDFY